MIQRLLAKNSGSVTSWNVVGLMNIGAASMQASSAEPRRGCGGDSSSPERFWSQASLTLLLCVFLRCEHGGMFRSPCGAPSCRAPAVRSAQTGPRTDRELRLGRREDTALISQHLQTSSLRNLTLIANDESLCSE